MLALLRLDAVVLFRAWPTLAWTLALATLPVYISVEAGKDEPSAVGAAVLSGSAAFLGLIGWFFHLNQVDVLAAVAPIHPRRRALHHLLVLAFAAALPAVLAAWMAGPPSGLIAGLAALGGWTLFLLAAQAARRWHPWIYAGLMATLAFLPLAAIGVLVWIDPTPAWIAVEAAVVGLLALAYLRASDGMEYGGTALLQLGEPRARASSTPTAVTITHEARRPAPLRILFKAAYARWVVLFFAAAGLPLAALPGFSLTVAVMFALAIQWPLMVWTDFQAAPLPRPKAFLTLMAPLFGYWFLTLALSAVVFVAHKDTDFDWSSDADVALGYPEGWNVSDRLDLKGGALYRIPSDPSAAASSVSRYLERVFSLNVPPAEILALRPEGTSAATPEWMQAVESSLRPRIRAVAVWLAVLTSLEVLILMLVGSSIYYLPRRSSIVYGAGMAALVLTANLLPGLREGSAGHLPYYYREIHLARPELWAAVLSAACVLLVMRHYAAFCRLQTGDVAWNASRGATSV